MSKGRGSHALYTKFTFSWVCDEMTDHTVSSMNGLGSNDPEVCDEDQDSEVSLV